MLWDWKLHFFLWKCDSLIFPYWDKPQLLQLDVYLEGKKSARTKPRILFLQPLLIWGVPAQNSSDSVLKPGFVGRKKARSPRWHATCTAQPSATEPASQGASFCQREATRPPSKLRQRKDGCVLGTHGSSQPPESSSSSELSRLPLQEQDAGRWAPLRRKPGGPDARFSAACSARWKALEAVWAFSFFLFFKQRENGDPEQFKHLEAIRSKRNWTHGCVREAALHTCYCGFGGL